jgi:hypothetical protein
MPTNQFYPFCPVDTGTNLESIAAYSVDANRTNGNQPGVASSNLNNRAIRQANAITSQIAQLMMDTFGINVPDDGNAVGMESQLAALMTRIAPASIAYTSGTGTWTPTYYFFTGPCNATNGATYSDGTTTFTVQGTVSASKLLAATGSAAPAVSGTLTKTGGTGDSSIAYYATRSPISLRIRILGGGGGGGGSGTGSPGTGGTGGTSTFGSVASVTGGAGGQGTGGSPGLGGTPTLTGVGTLTAVIGTPGGLPATGAVANNPLSGVGGNSPLGGQGPGVLWTGVAVVAGVSAQANTGSGASGASSNGSSFLGGLGGGAGGYAEFIIDNPLASYSYAVGAGGTAGGAGTSGQAGGVGGSGLISVLANYQ